MGRTASSWSWVALVVALAALVLGLATAVEAMAHHPGSHAWRQGEAVRLEAVVTAADACTSIAAVEIGTPPGLAAPGGLTPVVVRLARPADAPCAQVLTVLRREAALPVPRTASALMVYVLRADGSLQGSERVRIG